MPVTSRNLGSAAVRVTALLVALALASLYVAVLLIHLDDRFGLDTTGSAAWLGLTSQGGPMPPPLMHHGDFAGTRYMPLPLTILESVRPLLGHAIVAGKLISGASAALAVLVMVQVMRTRGSSFAPIALAVSLLLGSPEGTQALLGIHVDVLPASLQLAAVALGTSSPSRRRLGVASAVAGVAVAFKLTAWWGIATLIIWTLVRSRRRWSDALIAAASFTLAGLALWLPFQLLSHGASLDGMRALATSHEDPLWHLNTAWSRYEFLVLRGNRTTGVLLLAGLASMLVALTRRAVSALHIALLLSVSMAFPMFADRGVTSAHLVDQAMLAAVIAAIDLSALARSRPRAGAIVALGLVLVAAAGLQRQWSPVLDGLRHGGGVESRTYGDPLRGLVPPGSPILTEDAAVDALRGQPAVVADPFAFRRIAQSRSDWNTRLTSDLVNHRFAAVVLTPGASDDPGRYSTYLFGTPVYQAIIQNYQPLKAPAADGYEVFLPRK